MEFMVNSQKIIDTETRNGVEHLTSTGKQRTRGIKIKRIKGHMTHSDTGQWRGDPYLLMRFSFVVNP